MALMDNYNSNMGLIGSLLGGGLAGGSAGLFNGNYTNPADKAMPYLDKIPDELKPLFEPFMNTGTNSMNQLSGLVSGLANPSGSISNYNELAKGYTSSPGYEWQKDQMTQALNQNAAASGMAGSPSAQAALASMINGLSSQDFNNYMNRVSGMQNTGLQGLQGLTDLGFNASSQYSNDLLQQLMEQAGLAYAGQANKNNMQAQQNDMWSSLGAGLGTLAGFLR